MKDQRMRYIKAFLKWARNTNPNHLFLYQVAIGIAFLPISLFVGLGNLVFEGRQLGFLWAPNWSAHFVITLPALLYCAFRSFKMIEETLDAFAQSDPSVGINRSELRSKWRKELDSAALVLFLFFLVIILNSFAEWFFYSAYPLYKNDLKAIAEQEIDWAVAPFTDPESNTGWKRFGTALFSLLAVQFDIISYALIFWVFIVLIKFHEFLGALRSQLEHNHTVPNRDLSFASEKFAPLLRMMWLTVMTASMWLFLTRVQNAYLHSQNPDAKNIFEFVREDILRGMQANHYLPGPWLFEGIGFDFNGIQSSLIVLLLALAWFFLYWMVKDLAKMDPFEAYERRYRFLFSVCAIVGIILYRFAFYWAGIGLALLCFYLGREVLQGKAGLAD